MFNSDQFIKRQMTTSSAREFAKNVRLVEVGPRDGLQNEKQIIDTNIKGKLIKWSKVKWSKFIFIFKNKMQGV